MALFLLMMPRQPKFVRVTLVCLMLVVWFKLGRPQNGMRTQVQDSVTQPKTLVPPRILLVSALFPLENSKHSDSDYRTWLANFLGPEGIACDVYFYTTPALEPLVRSLHASSKRNHSLTINTTYATPFAIPPIAPYWAKYIQMQAWDRERDIHNPELYAIWNAKPWLLEQALHYLHRGPDNSARITYDYAFWNDAGSFRDSHVFGAWPDPERVDEVFETASKVAGVRKQDMVFVPLWKAPEGRFRRWTVDMGPVDSDISEGSFFGSTPGGVSWYARAYYAQHDRYISTALPPPPPHRDRHYPPARPPMSQSPPPQPFHFVGKDQTLINALMFRHPERFFGVIGPKRAGEVLPSPSSVGPRVAAILRTPPLPFLRVTWLKLLVLAKEKLGERCLDEWYYYQWWLAAAIGRRRTEKLRAWRRWRLGWFGGGEGCEETSVVSVKELLEGLFGPKWVERRRAREGDVF